VVVAVENAGDDRKAAEVDGHRAETGQVLNFRPAPHGHDAAILDCDGLGNRVLGIEAVETAVGQD
jgi:hypothetical protein